jgi:hypothetical protein
MAKGDTARGRESCKKDARLLRLVRSARFRLGTPLCARVARDAARLNPAGNQARSVARAVSSQASSVSSSPNMCSHRLIRFDMCPSLRSRIDKGRSREGQTFGHQLTQPAKAAVTPSRGGARVRPSMVDRSRKGVASEGPSREGHTFGHRFSLKQGGLREGAPNGNCATPYH